MPRIPRTVPIGRRKPSLLLTLEKGDYVLATKYHAGDAGDQFCIGFYDGFYNHYETVLHLVVDGEGKNFRANGFRRVAKISAKRGAWMVEHLQLIEDLMDRFSVWHWYRAPWRELREVDDLPSTNRA